MSDSARCTRQESVPVHRTGAASQTPLPQILNSIRRERALIERIDYNILFRWFIGPTWMNQLGIIPLFSKVVTG